MRSLHAFSCARLRLVPRKARCLCVLRAVTRRCKPQDCDIKTTLGRRLCCLIPIFWGAIAPEPAGFGAGDRPQKPGFRDLLWPSSRGNLAKIGRCEKASPILKICHEKLRRYADINAPIAISRPSRAFLTTEAQNDRAKQSMEELIRLSPIDLVWALGLMAIALGLSAWQRLGLEVNLAIATGRTVVQLLVVGYFLAIVFAWQNPFAILAVVLVMGAIATIVARNRISKKIPRVLPLVGLSMAVSTVFILAYTNLLILQPASWYEPQYLIPLAGIVLGNAMDAAAIAGERLTTTINSSHLEIETRLSLGATPQQAVAAYRRDAIKAGLIPILNAMLVVGIVKLPGIITGQILSGADPLDAASYQILIMFMLAAADLITTSIVTAGLCRQLFTEADQLRRY